MILKNPSKINMTFKIRFSTLSNSDLDGIISHFYNLNKETAKRYYTGILSSITKLKSYPAMGRIVPECRDFFYDKYREVIFENYRIVYRIESDEILIIRILDARMDIDYKLIVF